jgi:hypothetical protein
MRTSGTRNLWLAGNQPRERRGDQLGNGACAMALCCPFQLDEVDSHDVLLFQANDTAALPPSELTMAMPRRRS